MTETSRVGLKLLSKRQSKQKVAGQGKDDCLLGARAFDSLETMSKVKQGWSQDVVSSESLNFYEMADSTLLIGILNVNLERNRGVGEFKALTSISPHTCLAKRLTNEGHLRCNLRY